MLDRILDIISWLGEEGYLRYVAYIVWLAIAAYVLKSLIDIKI